MDSRETLERTLDRQLRWIAAADAKIPPVLAVTTAMLGVLSGFAPKPGDWTWLLALFTATALLMLSASVVNLFLAGFPRTEGPKRSLVYFGGISERSESEFIDEVLTVQDETYLRDLASQCYRNAEIAGAKFGHVKSATKLMFGSFLPWAIALYLMIQV